MGVKKFRPITPGMRNKVAPDFAEITTNTPEKSLITRIQRTGGRNNTGKMTMRYIGGGHKKAYRIIDFKRDKHNIPGKVTSIEYDPNRTAYIALLVFADGEKRYIIAPTGLKVGMTLQSGPEAAPELGNALPLSSIPLGSLIYNIELKPGKGGAIARSAGSYCQLLARDGKYATLKMPSGEMRFVLLTCYATIGSASNADHMNVTSGKAGRSRWFGIRPRVRGVAMNPVDHPMGGGEGRASGGHPRSRNGQIAKGLKTRSPKKYSDKMIISRRKS